jgi:hypothetical protein
MAPNDMRAAIARALADAKFSPEQDQPGQVVATYTKGARMLKLAIQYNPQQVTFRYVDSQGMAAGVDPNGQPMLDKHYRDIIMDLDAAVNMELNRPMQQAAPMDLAALIDQQAASAAPGARREGDYFQGNGDKSEWSVALNPNTCYWFIGVGDPGTIKRLEIYVWDPGQRRVTESHNDNNVAVAGTCTTAPGMFKFQAKVQSGGGDYKVAVFSRPQ